MTMQLTWIPAGQCTSSLFFAGSYNWNESLESSWIRSGWKTILLPHFSQFKRIENEANAALLCSLLYLFKKNEKTGYLSSRQWNL